jgi:NTE family protein
MSIEPTIGVGLGGGAARGWAHIGVLEALRARGVNPQVVSGASIGALVGAALAGGKLAALKTWVLALRRLDVLKLLDARFGAVATDLYRGRTIWLREGSTIAAVRVSCAFPGLFAPVQLGDASRRCWTS